MTIQPRTAQPSAITFTSPIWEPRTCWRSTICERAARLSVSTWVTGTGYSVLEVIETARQVTGRRSQSISDRGDPEIRRTSSRMPKRLERFWVGSLPIRISLQSFALIGNGGVNHPNGYSQYNAIRFRIRFAALRFLASLRETINSILIKRLSSALSSAS